MGVRFVYLPPSLHRCVSYATRTALGLSDSGVGLFKFAFQSGPTVRKIRRALDGLTTSQALSRVTSPRRRTCGLGGNREAAQVHKRDARGSNDGQVILPRRCYESIPIVGRRYGKLDAVEKPAATPSDHVDPIGERLKQDTAVLVQLLPGHSHGEPRLPIDVGRLSFGVQ